MGYRKTSKKQPGIFSAIVWVAALGYFVDIYDLLLFNMVRVDSLRAIGYTGRELEVGLLLHNIQMVGLMLGGILWGVLGDKRGRLTVLFGSILTYSIANFLNSYAMNFTQYAFLRFFAGFGLAGELGAGITLVSEILPPKIRGYGTMLVATVGVSGAILGGWVAQTFDWRLAYKIGGVLGLLLLLLRIGVSESKIFNELAKTEQVKRGSLLMLFKSKERFLRYLYCILAGTPIWFSVGILVAYSPEFAQSFEIIEPINVARAIMFSYLGFVLGDFGSGMLSQWLKSRNQAVKIFIILNALSILVFLSLLKQTSANAIYWASIALGTTGGYWAVIVTLASEQFGTNLRATVTTTVPNFIRFSLVPMSLLFLALKNHVSLTQAALVVAAMSVTLAWFSISKLKESFGRNLSFLEK